LKVLCKASAPHQEFSAAAQECNPKEVSVNGFVMAEAVGDAIRKRLGCEEVVDNSCARKNLQGQSSFYL
jgi:hypothetical protein